MELQLDVRPKAQVLPCSPLTRRVGNFSACGFPRRQKFLSLRPSRLCGSILSLPLLHAWSEAGGSKERKEKSNR